MVQDDHDVTNSYGIPTRRRRGIGGRFPRLSLCSPPSWMTNTIYNTFRYGLVLLYLGTLFMVIGYHNPWVSFIRYIGLAMVAVGVVCVGSAGIHSCGRLFHRNLQLGRHHQVQTGVEEQPQSPYKQGLPSYETVINDDLPTYEEAEELRLNPKFISEGWIKRHSVPVAYLSISHPIEEDDENDLETTRDSVFTVSQRAVHGPMLVPATGSRINDETGLPPVITQSGEDSSRGVSRVFSRLDSRRYSVISEQNEQPRPGSNISSTRQFYLSRPTTSNRRFDDVPEVHLTTPMNHGQMNAEENAIINQTDNRPQSSYTRRTSSAFLRSYSSSSFESIQEDSDSSDDSNWAEVSNAVSDKDSGPRELQSSHVSSSLSQTESSNNSP